MQYTFNITDKRNIWEGEVDAFWIKTIVRIRLGKPKLHWIPEMRFDPRKSRKKSGKFRKWLGAGIFV